MWCSKILVAYDGSASSAKALRLAREIASEDTSVELLYVHVVKLVGMGAIGAGAEGAIASEATQVLSELDRIADAVPNPARARLLKGTSPADLILKCAKDEGCDLIVMGSRGKGGVKGYLGSVSYAVVQGSPIAVLIAKDTPAPAGKEAQPAATASSPATDKQGDR